MDARQQSDRRLKASPLFRFKGVLNFALFVLFQIGTGQTILPVHSTLWTGVADVKVSGRHAYCSYHNGLVVLDVSDPSNMRQLAKLPCTGEGEGMTLHDEIIFLCMGSGGVSFIDVSNPESPALVGQWDSPGYAFDVEVEGDLAFIGDWWHGLQIINVSDLSNPVWIGSFQNQSFGWEVDVRDTIVAFSDKEAGTYLLNVADPSSPELLAHITEPAFSNDACIEGSLLYITSHEDGLWLYDISDPVNPAIVSSLLRQSITSCEIVNGIAYLGSVFGFMDIVDVTNPWYPHFVSRWHHDISQATILGQTVQGNIAYIPFGNSEELFYTYPNSGVFSVDVSDRLNPQQAGFLDSRGPNDEVVTSGNEVFVMKGSPSVSLMEWTAFGLMPVSTVEGIFSANDIEFRDNKLFIAHFFGGMTIYDVSRIESPQLIVDQLGLTSLYPTIAVDDSFAYLYSRFSLKIIDIRELPSLITLNEVPIELTGDRELYSSGGILYLAGLNGLQVYDARDVHNVDSIRTLSVSCTDLEVVGQNVWVSTADSNVYLFDVTNPVLPQEVLRASTQYSPTCLTLQGDYVWVGEGTWGVEVFHYLEQGQLQFTASWNSPGDVQEIATLDTLVVIADTYGVHVLDLDESSAVREIAPLRTDLSFMTNYPNPFNSSTRINFMLAREGRTKLVVYDVTGREVETLMDEVRNAGPQVVNWNAAEHASGIYFARLTQGERSQTLKMILIK